MIISLDTESLLQNLSPLHVTSLGEISDTSIKVNTTNAIYSKTIATVKLNGEKLKAIPLK